MKCMDYYNDELLHSLKEEFNKLNVPLDEVDELLSNRPSKLEKELGRVAGRLPASEESFGISCVPQDTNKEGGASLTSTINNDALNPESSVITVVEQLPSLSTDVDDDLQVYVSRTAESKNILFPNRDLYPEESRNIHIPQVKVSPGYEHFPFGFTAYRHTVVGSALLQALADLQFILGVDKSLNFSHAILEIFDMVMCTMLATFRRFYGAVPGRHLKLRGVITSYKMYDERMICYLRAVKLLQRSSMEQRAVSFRSPSVKLVTLSAADVEDTYPQQLGIRCHAPRKRKRKSSSRINNNESLSENQMRTMMHER